MMKAFDTCVGIDLARRAKHKAVVVRGGNGARAATRKRAFSFSHDREGFFALRDYVLKQAGAASLDEIAVNMEPTSGVWEPLAGFLRTQGADVFFTRTDVVAALRKAYSRHAKTDRIDARTLAGIPWSFPEKLVPTVPVEVRIRKLRALSAQRQRIVEDTTRWKNRLVAKLEAVWNPLLIHLDDAERFCQLARAFFKRFADPRKAVRLGRQAFLNWCKKNAHGNTSPDLFETFWNGAVKAAALVDMLEEADAFAIDWATLRESIAQDLRLIAALENETAKLDKRIKQAREDVPETDVVEQLPGVGQVIAVTLASILMPVARFANTKKCGAYTGFTSRRKSSAGREIEGLKITKTGNRRLKRDLALAADVAMKVDPQLAAFAIRLLRAGKHYNQVRVAVGHKLAVRAYSLLKRYGAGHTDVAYIWRDCNAKTITKQQAKTLARALWAAYQAEQKTNGSSSNPAAPWQPEDSTQRVLNELPNPDPDPITTHESTPKRTRSTWGKIGGNAVENPQQGHRKKPLICP
jgi:transposase